MKAIQYAAYGSPDVLRLEEVPKPAFTATQVLVKVFAASVNPLDWHLMRGEPFLARLFGGLFRPKSTSLGVDLAGQVEAVGKDVRDLRSGDHVFGIGTGSLAEYACADQNTLARKPANISFAAAAATPVAAITALQGLRDSGRIGVGQKVLINGASGGVGTFAVQIAKSFGADVAGVCSTGNVDMVRAIGADTAIDYTQEDFTKRTERYDLIFDAVGNRSVSEYRRALKPNGRCVIAGFSNLPRLFAHMIFGPLISAIGSKKVGFMGIAEPNDADLGFVAYLLESGKVTPVIDRSYTLRESAQAIRHLETGHARGKVVVTM